MSEHALDPPRCGYCGLFHKTICPRIKSIEFQEGGVLWKRVEFFSADKSFVIMDAIRAAIAKATGETDGK